jgi:hypothetical protein
MLAQLRWYSPHMLPLAAVLAAAIVTAVLWLYPAQVRRVRRPWRWVLPGLRAAALLALTASLLQPAVQRLRRAGERGAVLVLVDRSRSMSVADVTRTPAQLVALADGLARLPAGARAGETVGLAAEIERLRERVADVVSAGHDLETAEAFGRGIEAANDGLSKARAGFSKAAKGLAARGPSLPPAGDLRARVAALDVPDVPSRDAWAADALARIAAAHAAVSTYQADVDRKLYESNPQVKAVCDELARMPRAKLVEQALLRETTGLAARVGPDMPLLPYAVRDVVKPAPLSSDADGVASNIAAAVPAALADAGERAVRAVVLFSDGRQVGGEETLVSGLAPAGVPVFAVAVAPPDKQPDLTFARDVSVPLVGFLGETVTVRAAITAVGLPAGAADVQLKCGEVVQSQHVEYKPDGTPAPVEFVLRLEHAGPQRITLSIAAAAGEVTPENDAIERWVKVLPERVHVAAYAGTSGWDSQLLRNTLAQTPSIRLESAPLDPAAPKLPLTPEQILRQDVIILSDVPAAALDDVQWDAVNRLVRERGGSLFLLAGPDHLPSSYTPSTIVPSALLPYDVRSVAPSWRTWPGEQPAFRLVPAPGLPPEVSDALRLGPGAGNLRHWQDLPAAFRFMPVPELRTRINTRALLVESDSRLPVLTESTPGNGRVFFLGTNETWRWRNKVGGRDFDRFWRQLIVYAAGEPYAVRRDTVALDVDKIAPAPGDPLTVRALVLGGDAGAYRVEVRRGDAVVQEHALKPAGARPSGRFVANIAGLDAGDHQIRLTNRSNGEPLEVPVHVAASAEAELADVSGDADLLRRIAEASGGQLLTLDRLGELPALLAATGTQRSRYSEWAIWDSPLLFLFVVACLAAEWALRKRLGLA